MNLSTLPVKRTADAALQNSINISIIFHYLREHGPSYRAEISKELKISAPAVSRAVENLKKHGYVLETEKRKTKSGRNASDIMVNPEFGYVLGIDLIKERIRIGLFNFAGEMIIKHEGFRYTENTRDFESGLTGEIDSLLSASGIPVSGEKAHLKVISIGVPATVDQATGRVTATLYESLKKPGFTESIRKKYGVPVLVENITKLSTLGEHNFGQGKEYRDMVFIEVSRGIGAGIIIGNQLVRGAFGSAGEIGSVIAGRANLRYKPERNKGFLEHEASVESLVQKAVAAVQAKKSTCIVDLAGNRIDRITPELVCEAALEGDRLAKQIIREIVELLALGVVNLVLILNPEVVIIGGDICRLPGLKELFIQPLSDLVSLSVPVHVPDIMVSSLGKDAGIIGASSRAIESLILEQYPFKMEG